MSIILAIETSSELASCALLRGDTVTHRDSSGVRTHSQAILPMVQSLLDEAGITLRDCDAIAYGCGPGSFTGVRTACGVAQGLGFGASLPVVPVVTLEAMALACRQQYPASDIVAVLDARMGEVYWAQYHFTDAAPVAAGASPAAGLAASAAAAAVTQAPTTVLAPALSAPDAVQPQGAALSACGNGLDAYAAAFEGRAFAAVYADIMPHAIQIAQLGALGYAAGLGVSAEQAQPLYLRNKIAYTSAERFDMQVAKAEAALEAAK